MEILQPRGPVRSERQFWLKTVNAYGLWRNMEQLNNLLVSVSSE